MFSFHSISLRKFFIYISLAVQSGVYAEVSVLPNRSVTQVWSGQLEVLEQSGPGCKSAEKLPRSLAVHLAIERNAEGTEQVFIWGAMQPAVLMPKSGQSTFDIRLQPLGTSEQGTVTLIREGAKLDGTWSEVPLRVGQNGCVFTHARIRALELTPDVAQPLAEYARNAQRTYSQINAQGLLGSWPAQDLQTLLQQGEYFVVNKHTDASLAQAYLDVGESLRMQKRKNDAALVMRIANRIYAAHAAGQTEYVALGLGREASLLRSMRHIEEAQQLYQQAQQLLLVNGQSQSAAAAVLHNNYASLLLMQGNFKGALHEYTRAFDVDEVRGASASDLALSLLNLGETFESLGQTDAAVRLLQQGLDRLTKVDKIDTDLGKLIKSRLAALSARMHGSTDT